MLMLIGEVGLFIMGIIGLTTGKLVMIKNRPLEGSDAQTAGIVLVLPMPLALMIGFIFSFAGWWDLFNACLVGASLIFVMRWSKLKG